MPENQWSLALVSQLAGKVQQVHAAMDGELTVNYGTILRRYDTTEETLCQKFCSIRKVPRIDLVIS